jgi:hypothetical protein
MISAKLVVFYLLHWPWDTFKAKTKFLAFSAQQDCGAILEGELEATCSPWLFFFEKPFRFFNGVAFAFAEDPVVWLSTGETDVFCDSSARWLEL